jgi:hypothetical protein
MQDAIEPATLAGVLDEVSARGYTEHFMPEHGALRAVGSGARFGAGEVTISEYHRFEGVSDPDDMSILYAIETRSGVRGTLVDAFGYYSDPLVGEFMDEILLRSPSRAALHRSTRP